MFLIYSGKEQAIIAGSWVQQPFRWNIKKYEQLGQLVEGDQAPSYPGFIDDLRRCCARVLTLAGDSDLVFVGRSPESVFDYLSGVLCGTSWEDRIALFNISLRGAQLPGIELNHPNAILSMHQQLEKLELSPSQIIANDRSVAFVDVVASGSTFQNLSALLTDWSLQARCDKSAMARKVRFVGITWQKHTSPKTWRWHQHAPWLDEFKPQAVKNVSIPGRLWDYLGNNQQKVARWNPPGRWGDAIMLEPPREQVHLEALRLALFVYRHANQSTERALLARELVNQPAMKEPWFRALVTELRGLG